MTEDCFAPAIGHAPAFKTAASVTTVPEAERVFSEWFGAPVVLTSSGRTAISLYLGVTGHERYRHSVAVPRMISACVLDAVIRHAFPVDAARQQAADTTLLYHQYGFMQSARPQGRVLEDISHSFFASASTGARPWAGDAAVFSLQKFFPLATMVGGLVVRDVDLARTVRDARDAYVEPDANRRREHGAVLAAVPGRERENPEVVYLERLLNPRLHDEELGGIPLSVDAIRTVGARRAEIAAGILATVPSDAYPKGWSIWLGNMLPFALPVFGDRKSLEKLDRDLAEIGVSAGIYSIDTACNMLRPNYASALLLPCHDGIGESRLNALLKLLGSHLRSAPVSTRMTVHRLSKDPKAYEWFRSRAQLPSFMRLISEPTGRKYYSATNLTGVDESFLIETDGSVDAIIECDASYGARLERFGMPLEIQLDGRRSRSHRKKTLRDAMSELLAIARRRSVRIIRLRTSLRTDADGLIAGHLLSTAATHSLEFRAVIDLTRSADELFGDMRKGHRQQIRWGQANMQVQVVDSTTGDRCSFDAYRALHAAAAGRITRGGESWAAMFDAIVSGSGDLVLGSIDGQLVSGTLILDAGDTAYYSSGAYDRSRFDKPLAHWPLFNAILRAKNRGLRWFDVGEIGGSGSAKEQSIAYFKGGFSSTREMSVIWTLPVSNPQTHTPSTAPEPASREWDKNRVGPFPASAETERLIIRPLCEDDITDAYLKWFRDREVTKYLEASHITRRDSIDFFRLGVSTAKYRVYAVCIQSSGEHIGNMKLGPVDAINGVTDLTIVIGARSRWGKGYGCEAIRCGIGMAFNQMGLRKIAVGIYADNVGSLNAYARAGFVPEAVRHANGIRDGKACDSILVSCFNPVFFEHLPPFPKPFQSRDRYG